MAKKTNTTQILNEMKEWLDNSPALLEGFYLPEEDDAEVEDEVDFEIDEPVFDKKDDEPIADASGIEGDLTQIRKIALSAINRLADQPQSQQYDIMKKIWNMVDKAMEQPIKKSDKE